MLKYKKMERMSVKILIIIFLVLILGLQKVDALGENFSLDFSPENPGPNTNVTATVSSYSYDLSRASITWLLNGQKKLSGQGETNFSFKTGNTGSTSNVSIYVVTQEGFNFNKSVSFKSASVDLLWKALNYVPLAYKGKALPSTNSIIKITAIPQFSNSSNLFYEWSMGYKSFSQSSGLNKSSFVFETGNSFEGQEVSVVVSNSDKTAVAKSSININPVETKIIFYEDNYLTGPQYNKALIGDFKMEKEKISLRAEPFYFSNDNLSALTYKWSMNGKEITTNLIPNVLSLDTGGDSGSSNISLKLTNTFNIFQYADNSIKINY
jgi:hypothetical protein